ncbi:Ig-like protein group 2, partial [Mangrovibacterium marinum]
MNAKTLPLRIVRKLFMLIAFMAMFLPAGFAQEVSIFTDKDDYYPGEWVVITGSGWENDESVLINLTHIEPNIPDHTHDPWYLYPDANGDIYDEWFVFDEELGTTFWMTATGTTTGLFAETTFTDGNAVTFIVGTQTGDVYSGIGGDVTYVVDATRDGAKNAFTSTLSTNNLPVGATAVFSPNPLSFPGERNVTRSSVLTLTVANTVTEGTYAFTIVDDNGSDPANATLIVSGCAPPTAYMVTGTGAYCTDDAGLAVGLNKSETGVTYQLYLDGTIAVGSPVAGTGSAISFGIQPAGTYTVVASRVAGGCTNNMNGSAVLTENTIDPGSIAKGATNPGPGCGSLNPNAAGTIASGSTEASGSGTITYQWEMSLDESSWDEITSATSSSFNIPEISQTTFYRRVATSTSNGVECSAISNELEYIVYPLPEVAAISADGSTDICVGSTVQLSCSTPGGTWSSDDPSIATVNPSTGLVTGIAEGTLSTGIHYTVTSNDGCSKSANKSISVLPLPEVPTANNVTVTYDGTSHSASATVPSGYEIDWYTTETGSTTTTAPTGTNAGTHTAWAEARTTMTGCLSDGRTEVTLVIEKRPITITADAGQTKVYGEADPLPLTYQVTSGSLASGDAFDGVLERVSGETVGTYPINKGSLTIAEGATNKENNYNVTYESADLTINPLAVTVTADAQSKTYGDVDPALTFVSVPAVGTSLANGETISFTGVLSRVAGEDVGAYAINQNTVENTNYDITYTSADLTIGQLAVTVTADAQSKTYGDLDPELTFVASPAVGTVLANGEVIKFTGVLSRVAGEDVGAYAINQNTVENTNYDITYTSADLTIGQLAVTVTADAQSKTYGDLDPELTFVASPAVGTVLANGEV